VQFFAAKSMLSEVVLLVFAPPKRSIISRHFSTLGATFDTRQRIFDLMVFALVESRFPKARKATQKNHSSISRLGTQAPTHSYRSINTIS
jgi:hypothetical protein